MSLWCSLASASPAAIAEIVGGVVAKVVSTIFKRLWSLKPTVKTAIPSHSMMKFEGGYTVETMFDGSKPGIEPYAVEISDDGEIFVLDSKNSNIYKISTPLSRRELLVLCSSLSKFFDCWAVAASEEGGGPPQDVVRVV